MPIASSSIRVVQDGDPKKQLLDAVSDKIKGIQPLSAQILVGVYQRGGYGSRKDAKTLGGIYLPENANALAEDQWQGKIGLVIAMGPLAFKDDPERNITWPIAPKIGDWVLFRVGDTFGSLSGDQMFRFLDESAVKAIIEDPQSLY